MVSGVPIAASVVSSAIFAMAATSTQEAGEDGPVSSIVLHHDYPLIGTTALCLALAVLGLAVVSLWRKRIPFTPALWIAPLVVFPAAFVVTVLNNLSPWTACGSAVDSTSSTYRFLDSSLLQGQEMVISRLVSKTRWEERFEVLAWANGDSPRSYLRIVRPAGAKDSYGQLYLTRNNWLVGIRYDNHMFMAYDLTAGKAYSGDTVMELSPFLLLDKDTALSPADAADVLEAGIGSRVGQPRRTAVIAELTNTNQRVRAFAKKLLEAKARP